MLSGFRKGCARLVAGLAGVALVAGCAAQTQQASGAAEMRPALWRLADADTTIYLFGTIHTLPEGVEWRTARLEEALTASQELVTEIQLDGNEAAAAAAMMRLAMRPGLPPLLERVPEEHREELRQAVAASGVPASVFDNMKSWGAAMMLAVIAFQRAGLNAELGVDRQLTATFREANKRMGALETIEEQLGFFDGLPEETQRQFLVAVLETPEELRREFDAMLAAWRAGDTQAIARTFDDETMISPELRERLMTRRNARWAEWLQRRMAQPGTVFVAVGAGHLAGRDSVQRMLRQRGLRARRVQ